MSEEPKVTETEARRRERRAFSCGARHQYNALYNAATFDKAVEEEARKRYPITKRVPRVLTDGVGTAWRCVGTSIQSHFNGVWCDTAGGLRPAVTAERVKLWADLLANPYETVEE